VVFHITGGCAPLNSTPLGHLHEASVNFCPDTSFQEGGEGNQGSSHEEMMC